MSLDTENSHNENGEHQESASQETITRVTGMKKNYVKLLRNMLTQFHTKLIKFYVII